MRSGLCFYAIRDISWGLWYCNSDIIVFTALQTKLAFHFVHGEVQGECNITAAPSDLILWMMSYSWFSVMLYAAMALICILCNRRKKSIYLTLNGRSVPYQSQRSPLSSCFKTRSSYIVKHNTQFICLFCYWGQGQTFVTWREPLHPFTELLTVMGLHILFSFTWEYNVCGNQCSATVLRDWGRGWTKLRQHAVKKKSESACRCESSNMC